MVVESFEERKKATLKRLTNRIIDIWEYSPYNKRLLKRYNNYLKTTPLSLQTKKSYLQALRSLIVDTGQDINKITNKHIKNYLVAISEKLKPKSILERKKFLLVFFTWFCNKDKEVLKKGLLKGVEIKKEKIDLISKPVLKVEEIGKMIQVAKTLRDKAIISMLFETGARKGEFLQLRIRHLEFTDYGCRIAIPKGKTTGRYNFLIDSYPYLKEFYESHPDNNNPEASLWINLGAWTDRAMGEDGLKRLLKENAKRAKIRKNITPHLLRHSKATWFARHGKNEDFLRKWFGWSRTSTTPSIYIHTNSKDLENEYLIDNGVKEAEDNNKTEKEILRPKTCPRCKEKNIQAHFKLCPKCSMALDLEVAQKLLKDQKKQMIVSLYEELISKENKEKISNMLIESIKENACFKKGKK